MLASKIFVCLLQKYLYGCFKNIYTLTSKIFAKEIGVAPPPVRQLKCPEIKERGMGKMKLIAQLDDLCYSYLYFCVDHPR